MLVESPYSHDSSIFGIERIGAWHYLLGIWAFVSRHFIHLFTPGLRYGPSLRDVDGSPFLGILEDDILPFHSTACLRAYPHPCMLALALTHVRSGVLLRADSESDSRYSLTQQVCTLGHTLDVVWFACSDDWVFRDVFQSFIGIFELQIFDPSCLGLSGIVLGFDPFCFGFSSIVPGFDPRVSGSPASCPDSIPLVLGSPALCPDSIPLVLDSIPFVSGSPASCLDSIPLVSGSLASCPDSIPLVLGSPASRPDSIPFASCSHSIVSGFDPFCFGFSDIMPGFDPVGLEEDLEARPLLKVGWQVVVKAQSWSLAQEPLSVLFGGLREMGSWLLMFLAMADLEKVERGWSEVRVGLGFRRRSLEIPLKMVLWFGSILHLRRVFVEQMTSVKWNLAI
ncbi:hypothetical protein CK203_065963 [Vitis vinifera]|uniref:Uncharacterized protein n=1 Tax=Vitis vinifera TaxID=29760 RepID=A0A438FNI5_VITVI|nr:hypothetical protein CK203_065963 [Vitis vinifera]